MALKENYKDDVFTGKRKYNLINNDDGTISLDDVTEYSQEGDSFGAKDINDITNTINKSLSVTEITLTTTWSGDDTSGYSQTVSVPGITENDRPDIYVKLTEGDKSGNDQKNEEFNKLSDSWTHTDSIVFYASEKTTIELTLIVKGR